MREHAAVEAFEVERKYEVDDVATPPTAEAFASVGVIPDTPELQTLHATYFDTPDGALARQRLALRVRHGGKDAGWHLKEKSSAGAHELLWPPSPEMPKPLFAEIKRRIGESAKSVRPIAELSTERTVILLRDAEGNPVVEFADDRVRATDHGTSVKRAWREWEAELMPDADGGVLDSLEPVLVAAGAVPSLSPAKIARATGRLVGLARVAGADEARLAALRELDAADREAARRLGL